MKKTVLTLLVCALVVPVAAQTENAPQPMGKDDAPAIAMQRDHKAFEKARKEHRAQIKATKEKMEKLVKEYNKLKDGKKKDAKRAEIEQEISAIHEKQLAFKKDQLAKFEERLARMKDELAKETSSEEQKSWVSQKADEVIAAQGDVRVLFMPPQNGPQDPRMDGNPGHGPRMGKGPHRGGHRGFFTRGPKGPRPPENPTQED